MGTLTLIFLQPGLCSEVSELRISTKVLPTDHTDGFINLNDYTRWPMDQTPGL
jgi:hypothetical protein